MHNSAIADALQELADLYALDGADVHRVLAYRNAAASVRACPVSVAALARQGRARQLPKIGATIEGKIVDLLQTGSIPAAHRLRERFPTGLIEIARLPGVGAKRVRLLHDELGIDSVLALETAAKQQRLRDVKGLGPKFEQRVLEAIDAGPKEREGARTLLPRASEIAESIVAGLRQGGPEDARIEVAGSIRRSVDAVSDIDLVAVTVAPAKLNRALQALEQIQSVSSASVAGARARTHSGLALDLRIATPDRRGNLLQHFTGSAAHNAALRQGAVRAGLHLSEHGIEDERSRSIRTCESEEEVYQALRLQWIPPELREDRGELAAACIDRPHLPALIEEEQIEGDLHCHTVASDGAGSIAEMAQAAADRGYNYLAITDHSATHGFGNHVSREALQRQIERIREIDASTDGFSLLAGSEVNVLPDGSLDYDDDLLAELDWVIASVHTAFATPSQQMTKRIVAAIENPLVDAIGHPTGRLIERRQPYAFDFEQVVEAAARSATMLEINGNPNRRDLSDIQARAAAQAGVQLVIDSDAHRPQTLSNMRWGIATARRAWLTPAQVANTRPWSELSGMRKRHRR